MSADFKIESLEPYVGKTIHLEYVDPYGDGEVVEKTGEILNLRTDVADPILLFNPRGRGVVVIIEGDQVRGFRPSEQAGRLRLVTKRSLRLPRAANIRRHLADAHGWSLEKVNSMGDEAALRDHEKIDHGPLAHDHELSESGAREPVAMKSLPVELRERINAAEQAAA